MVDSAKRKHLGRGISFPMRINHHGSLTLSQAVESIEESILIILLTEPGERRYRPDFGCRIHELAFAPLNADTLVLIKIWVQEALEKWEPRIEIENIVTRALSIKGQVDIQINYRLKSSYDRRSLIYPFFLKKQT